MSDSAGGNTFAAAPVSYVSFDGSTRASTVAFKPDRYRFWDVAGKGLYGISRGAGLSYTPASFSPNGATVDHSSFNRILGWDAATGIIEVETGITLGQIYNFAFPRGFFLPVQPGHPKITVGGCIGADVHGKNQFRDGTFLSVLDSIRLFHPDYGVLELSRSNPGLFALTCGGYGLTGNVLTARLRLAPLRSSSVQLRITTIENILELDSLLNNAAEQSDLVYSWHDFTARGQAFGKGFIVEGQLSMAGGTGKQDFPASSKSRLDARSRGNLCPPFFSTWTTPLFNRLYHASIRLGPLHKQLPIYDFLFPVSNKEVYFHLFGTQGFHELQILVPCAAFSAFAMNIRNRLEKEPVPVTLASAKVFRGKRDFVRFTGDGICLALNFPRTASGARFASFLDEAMLAHGGWPNIIKDSRLSRKVISRAYPEFDRFREELHRHDNRRTYRSMLSERLEL